MKKDHFRLILEEVGSWPGRSRFWSISVFAVPFLTYFLTLPRTTSFEDSAEFVTAAAVLGVPHPSGYPLYVLFAHVFSWLPFGTVPWRVALFSALTAAVAVWLAHDIAWRLIRRSRLPADTPLIRLATAAAAVAVGLSPLWWSQAIYAKVYSLHSLLLLLAVWGIVMAGERLKCRWLVFSAFAFGLALANHFSLAAAHAPFLLLAVVFGRPEFFRPSNWKIWMGSVAAFIGAAVPPYLWLWFRSAGGAPYSIMTRISTWNDLVDYVLRRPYGDQGIAAWNKFGVFGDMIWQYFLFSGLAVVLAAALGFWWLGRQVRADWRAAKGRWWAVTASRSSSAFLIAAAGAVLAAPLAVMLRQAGWTSEISYISRVYGLAVYPMLAVSASVGAAWVTWQAGEGTLRRAFGGFFGRRFGLGRSAAAGTAIALILIFLGCQAVRGWSYAAAYRHPFPYDHLKAVLTGLPQDSVLLVNDGIFTGDTELFTLAYLQKVEGFRTDVAIVNDAAISDMALPQVRDGADYAGATEIERRQMMMEAVLFDERFSGRPLFSTYPAEQVRDFLRSMSNGLVYAVSRPYEPAPESLPFPDVRLPDAAMLTGQPALAAEAAHLLYARAAWTLDQSGLKASTAVLQEALKYDAVPMSPDYLGYMVYRRARMDNLVAD